MGNPFGQTTSAIKHFKGECVIVGLSLLLASAIIIISVVTLVELLTLDRADGLAEDSQTLGALVIIVIALIACQIVASVTFWRRKERRARFIVEGFALGHSIIQLALVVCVILFALRYFKPQSHGVAAGHVRTHSTGHGFWVIILMNVVFHIGAVAFLIYHVVRPGHEDMEEMSAVVIHRKVPSRIPSTRKHRSSSSENAN